MARALSLAVAAYLWTASAFWEDEEYAITAEGEGDFTLDGLQSYGQMNAQASGTVVAIDFGTVGVSYAIVSKQDALSPSTTSLRSALQAVKSYSPGVDGTSTSKTDNVLLFEPRGVGWECTAYGPAAHERYANAKAGSAALFSEYKMFLKGDSPSWDTPVWSMGEHIQLPLGTLLRAAFKELRKDIAERVAILMPGLQHRVHEFTYVLTVPAIWTEKAKHLMRKAAYEGGLTASLGANNLELALEPEAAVSEALLASDARVGTTVAVVDAGGGTVDIVVAEVAAVNPIRLKIVSVPSGGPWGGKEVNARFMTFLKDLLGPHARSMDAGALHALTQEFEDGKKAVTLDSELDLTLKFAGLLSVLRPTVSEQVQLLASLVDSYLTRHRLAGGPDAPVATKRLKLKLSHSFVVKTFFDPVVQLTTDHMETLLASKAGKGVKLIIAAGGFAESDVFTGRLEARMDTLAARMRRPIHTLVAKQPGMAIVRGASLFGMFPNVMVTSRVLKYSYAIVYVTELRSWLSEGLSTRGCVTMNIGGELFVEFASAVALEGKEMAVDEKRSSRFTPVVQTQTRVQTNVVVTDYPFKREGDKACLLDGRQYPRTAGVWRHEIMASINIDIGEEWQSREEKSGTTYLYFGRTEVEIESVGEATGDRKASRIEFK